MSQPKLPLPHVRPSRSDRPPTKSNLASLERQQQVRQFPAQPPVPVWLKSLLTIHRGAKPIFGSIFGLSLLGYSYTVYTQDVWKQQHGQLKRLQSQERQQVVMTENLKHQLATTAERPDSQLVAPNPQQLLFVTSATPRPTKPLPIDRSTITAQPPSGY